MFKRIMIACLIAAPAPLIAQNSPSRAVASGPQTSQGGSAERFGARESVTDVDISPDGTKVLYLSPGQGRSTNVYVQNLSGGNPQAVIRSDGNPERLAWCRFVSDSRIICRVIALVNMESMLVPFSRLLALDVDGGNVQSLGQRASSWDGGIRQYDGDIMDWMPGQDGRILMSRQYVPEVGRGTGSLISRTAEGLGVDRIDTRSLRTSQVERPNPAAASYLADGGEIRIMGSQPVRGRTGLDAGRTDYFYRLQGASSWQSFSSFDADGEGMLPIAIDGAINAVYVLKKLDGRQALYLVKLDGTMASELVYANPRVDVDNVVRVSRGSRVIGVTFAEEKRRTVYFDPEYEALARSLGRAIPNLPLIDFVGASQDNRTLLIHAGADNDPGRYFIFNRANNNLNAIILVRPELENVRLASVRPVTYPASDGTSIPGYLTLPPNAEGRNLPAVVLPHGGPSARDEWGFDWLAQYLANQGYAVLQPNYRGSAGYGDAWLQSNGFQGWRTSIGDVTAGARWLASQGIADVNRLAIVGWSYGGYAALQAGVVDPDLFKAIVAIAPVTDLQQLRNDARDFTSARNVSEFIGSGPHVTEGSPARQAARVKAPVILFHGDRDLNVRVVHSRMMDSALRSAGGQSQLSIFPGLEHDLDNSDARVEMLRSIGAFLGRTIGGSNGAASPATAGSQ